MIQSHPTAVAPGGPDSRSLASMLRDATGTVPDDHVDWNGFHSRLSARAELPLARLRHPAVAMATGERRTLPLRHTPTPVARAWWEHAARWSRLTVGSALGAGVALVTVIVRTVSREPGGTGATLPPA